MSKGEREEGRERDRGRKKGGDILLLKGLERISRCISCLRDKNVPFNSTDKVNKVTNEGCAGFICE